MDGCKKVFAREADLKRHQRTTKTHSVPGFQCPQCDATFTRTDALRRHQKSRHNGVVIEPEPEKGKSADGASSGSRSPSPAGTVSVGQGEGSPNGSPPAGSNAASSSRTSSYYRSHTIQDSYYSAYSPVHRPPPPGMMMMDPNYPPTPIGLPTSATRGNWQPTPAPASAPPPHWGPDSQGMPPPPPGMYIPYYAAPYYRPPGMPMPPHPSQINPELLEQSNGHTNGVGPPESALRNTSAEAPRDASVSHDADMSGAVSVHATSSTREEAVGPPPEPLSASANHDGTTGSAEANGTETPDASTLMAAAALQAVLAYQKEQEIREAVASQTLLQPEAASQSPPQAAHAVKTEVPQPELPAQVVSVTEAGPSAVPVQVSVQEDDDADAIGEPDSEMLDESAHTQERGPAMPPPPPPMDELVTEDGLSMLNPAELLTQESLASPPPS
ncbi:hypothetical protein OH76DRAFT_1402582 [Lentinus brumalis]|uniref:C2H2-type domain-containing protein n=1 Tax=Lentinus brumalis TaxID=2498619 RepID=A0A371DD94_9APHY|nr:hypothetical protein OH76DRAFT_1402582 [Polyporus brumalis]